jgi:L-galactonate dehydratase
MWIDLELSLVTDWNFSRIICSAIGALAPRVVGRRLSHFTADMGLTQRNMCSGQIRCLSPERGVLQLGCCAVLNALWDLWAKCEGKPLWRLVADFTPEQLVQATDFRYISDAISKGEALQMLRALEPTKHERIKLAEANRAVPAYSKSSL